MPTINSNIDFHKVVEGRLSQHINCSKYDSPVQNWKTIEELKAAGASSILVLPIEKYIQ